MRKKLVVFFLMMSLMVSLVRAPAGLGSCSDETDFFSCYTTTADVYCTWDSADSSCKKCSDYDDTLECSNISGCYPLEIDEGYACVSCDDGRVTEGDCNNIPLCDWDGACQRCFRLDETDCNNGDDCNWNGTECQALPYSVSSFPTGEGSTDFSTVSDMSSVSGMKLATSDGYIEWSDSVNAEAQDFDSNVLIGSGFVSVDTANLDSSMDSSATVSVSVAGCTTWTIYYADHPVSSLTQLMNEGQVVGTSSDGCDVTLDGDSQPYCSNVECTGGTLTYDVLHFDGTGGQGGDGGGEDEVIPEFSSIGLILVLFIVTVGFYWIKKRR